MQNSKRPRQQLTNRLDILQDELDKKTEEFNILHSNLHKTTENIEKKTSENKELVGKLFFLEEKNLLLEQELSILRASQKEIDTYNKTNKKPFISKIPEFKIHEKGAKIVTP